MSITFKAAKLSDIPAKGRQVCTDYDALLNEFSNSKAESFELDGIPQNVKEVNKIVVALKKARTRLGLKVGIVQRNPEGVARVWLTRTA